MKIDTPDLKYGFWVGIGLLLAVFVVHLVSKFAQKAVHHDG